VWDHVVTIVHPQRHQVGEDEVREENNNNFKINNNIMEYTDLIKGLVGTLVYSVLGIFIMTISFIVIEKITNFSVKKEIIEDENIALGTMFAGFFIAVAIIIAAAII
jgi:putative membrane protein